MKIANIQKKLEKIGATNVNIKAELALWGGYNVFMTASIGNYYDFRIMEQIHKSTADNTPEEAIEMFLAKDVDYYCTKPWHMESDSMSDYNAWSFHRRINDLDWRMKSLSDIPATAMRKV